MLVEATTQAPLDTTADTIAVGVVENESVPHDLPDGSLEALRQSGEARAKLGSLAVTHSGGRRFLLVGLGPREGLEAPAARLAAAIAVRRAGELGAQSLCWELPHRVEDTVAGGLVEGTLLGAYRFERYRPAAAERGPQRLIVSAHHDVAEPVRRSAVLAEAQNRARDLANTPANELTPSGLAEYAVQAAERFPGLSVSVMDDEQIRAAGMGAFAAVAQGSREPARLIVARLERPEARGPLLGFLGKAVTFDTGGLSLKPPGKMHEMKFDMAGGAAVVEAVCALAELGVPARVIAVVGATENMPDGGAVKPGDIVRAGDGTTIEVNNTDAEGRLVLADCLLHARELGAERLVDLATLTGGVLTALGSIYAGLMGNDEGWVAELLRASAHSGERIWRLPLDPEYAEMVKGRYAQLTNLTERREASTITAAEFLHHFAGDVPWAHVDIAGTAYDVPGRLFAAKAATGFGVRLLFALAEQAAAG